MRFIFFILFFPSFVAAQITDNFSDNDFSATPSWNGDSIEFIVNASQQLQLNNTVAGASYLSIQSSISSLNDTEWRFYIKQSFSPSSSNYGRVYLASDQADLEGSLNGYYLQFGESGSMDAIELFRQAGSTGTSVARCSNAQIASSFVMGIKVTRDTSGNWSIYVDAAGGTAYILEASGIDNTFSTGNYFGISTVYTASNSNKFYFDDFYIGPIIIDISAATIVSSTMISDTQVDILFNENIDLSTSQTASNYNVDNGIGSPSIAVRDAGNFSLVHLTFEKTFVSEVYYTLTSTNIKDFNSNAITSEATKFSYYRIKPLDLVINEILFDPKTGGVDFVEIYNRSTKPINLKTITISQYDTINNVLMSVSNISTNSYLIFPQEYLVLSENKSAVKDQYRSTNPNGFLDLNNLPSMNIAGGTVCLANGSSIIDFLTYYEDMHFPLLNSTKGVSLERIDFNRATQDRTNWHSAAETVGFATPAYRNSQYNDAIETIGTIEISPEIFSPDEDGMNDIVNINYHFETPGTIANIIIYDSKGRLVRSLVSNQLLGTNGTYSWDGINEEKEKSRIGIYIIYTEITDLSGNVKHYKKTCVLGGRL
ncbi:MAG: lamin tail domain-containing protein [Bacteroidota bacterium]